MGLAMAITLITGPANAGKARAVLDAVRVDAARELEPLLIVPTHADVERYRRELAEGGVRGARVERFEGLLAEVVRRAGVATRALTPLLRRRVLAAVAARRSVNPELAARPGFVRALAALVGELEVERVTPGRLRQALAVWVAAEQDGGHDRRAEELRALFAGYHELLERLGRSDPDQRTAAALDAIRRTPALWGGTPVHLYGFDDLTRLQLDAIETLGRIVDAPMTVSLAYEPGRVAFAGRAGAFQTLLPWASEHRALSARAEYYAEAARSVLHHLERGLFEQPPSQWQLDPGQSLRLLEGGSPRAELELVAGEIAALLDRGFVAGEIALVHRSPHTIAQLVAEVLDDLEIPFAMPRRLCFDHTSLGHALCGLLAAALGGQPGVRASGTAADLLAWLRAPGLLERPELADRLEATARRRGLAGVAAARALWEEEQWPLDTLDHVLDASRRGPLALIERTQRELQRLFAASQAQAPAGTQIDEAGALTAATQALTELAELARSAPQLAPNPGELLSLLRGLELPGEPAEGDAVAVLDPLSLRARRVRALFLCGLQADVFPAPARPQPWLSEEERRRLAQASGLRLSLPEPSLAAERYLFYAAISRPEELLALSWHTAGDDGESTAPSLFLDDVCDLFTDDLRRRRALRPAGAAAWPGPGAPPATWAARELALSSPRSRPPTLGPLRDERLLAELRLERLWSASGLMDWHGCPAKWFTERLLGAADIDPEGEPLARGGLAHAALRDTLEGLRARFGSARLTPAHLPAARALLHEALARHAYDFPLSVAPERIPGVRRRLEADLERYLEHACEQDSPLEPTHLELDFGFATEPAQRDAGSSRELDVSASPRDSTPARGRPSGLPPLDLGAGVRVRGRIDRIDLAPNGQAVVYDYKGTHAPPAGRWLSEGHLQLAIYMRAVEQLLHDDVVGGFYQPLAGRDLRARGLLDAGSGVQLECVRGDAREHDEVQQLMDDVLALARTAAHEADLGLLEARPGSCGFGDGACLYPSICRCQP
jgi:PD-(D/E)XK nuclease superfamily